MNHFAPKESAKRYALGRPNFHSNTISKVKEYLEITSSLDKVLDVACGTGLSSVALLDISKNVFATDLSEEMLANAAKKDTINYSISKAEELPFTDSEFDLITVCSGIHWFDIDAFLLEANRLLKPEANLVIYDNFFISEMEGEPNFDHWFPNVYLEKFPSPPRKEDYNWSKENVSKSNLEFIEEVKFKNHVNFTKAGLVLYFTTQSNITAAISNGANYDEIESWLSQELEQFFETAETAKKIYFGNWIKYLKKTNPSSQISWK